MFFVVLLLLQESIQIAHYYLSLRFFRYVQFLFVAPCIPYDNLHFRDREAARVYREFILDRLQKLQALTLSNSSARSCTDQTEGFQSSWRTWIFQRRTWMDGGDKSTRRRRNQARAEAEWLRHLYERTCGIAAAVNPRPGTK